jgi:galactokinase
MHKQFQTLFPDTDESSVRNVYSPYRICPVGAHIDHQHGHVTGFALDKGVNLLYVPTESGIINLFSNNFNGQVLFTLKEIDHKFQNWGQYVQAAIYGLSKNQELTFGIQGLISGSLPVGGLSSSAAVLLCYIMALADVNNIKLSEDELIDIAYKAEKEYIGLNLGKLDHSCEILCKKDHLLYLDTKDGFYKLIPAPSNLPEFDILIFFSGLTRTLINTNYNTRTDECKVAAYSLMAYEGIPHHSYNDTLLRLIDPEVMLKWEHLLPPTLAKRANHYLSEFERVNRAIESYSEGDLKEFGSIMFESGHSSIHLWEAGCPEMIELYNIMRTTDGIYGGRFSGAGFKGCCIALSDPSKRKSIMETVSNRYLEQFPELNDNYSAHVCHTANGASRIK